MYYKVEYYRVTIYNIARAKGDVYKGYIPYFIREQRSISFIFSGSTLAFRVSIHSITATYLQTPRLCTLGRLPSGFSGYPTHWVGLSYDEYPVYHLFSGTHGRVATP